MRIIINDSSALIDLAKTWLLESLLRLPYRFVIPDVLYADELITSMIALPWSWPKPQRTQFC